MSHTVVIQVGAGSETPITDGAFVGSFTAVDASMSV